MIRRPPNALDRVEILGCPVDNVSMEEAIAKIEELIRTERPGQVVTLNAAFLWAMDRDARLDRIVKASALIVPEKAIVMGARFLGRPLKAHVGGIMLLRALFPVATRRGYRLFFFGAEDRVVQQMVRQMREDWPALTIAGWHHGYVRPEDDAGLVEEIQAARPDILLVALGNPKQEYWIADHLDTLGVPVLMGVGGSFDVLAGFKREAPPWVRRLALEWLFRVAQDPRRLWRRYLVTIPWFLLRVGICKVRGPKAL